jgi:Family of unknown function (DUF6600)
MFNLKAIHTGKGRLTLSLSRLLLSLSLMGLLGFYATPKALAQDAPPNASSDQAPASQAPPSDQGTPDDQNPSTPAPPPDQPAPPAAQGAPNPPASPNAGDQAEPPSRAARISYLEGSVSLQPGGQGDWGNAARNRPVTIGDKIWVDQNGRAELEAGQVTFHLGRMTAFSFLNLDGPVTQVRLPEGSVNFRVREMREGDIYEVDTPNVAFTIKEAGAYRIDVSENGDGTRITAIRGEGDVTADGQTYTVHPGERAEFVGTDNGIQYTAHGAPPPDSLDRWANDRDLREDNSTSARYVNRDVPGVADLDDNGTWSEQPDVGSVWYPNNVGPDWAPYSDGAWNYVGPWGWSWVGYEPWGFAPYHYGRWGFYGGRWGWIPGPIWSRPYYGPAFVGFLGGGFGFGVGFGFGFGGGIGWFPLGFGEPFHPWYHAGFGYIHNINIHNTVIRNTNIINNSHNFNYAYAHNEHAVTAASRSTFTNGERVNRGAAHISAASLRSAQVTNGAGVSPNRSSFSGAAAHAGSHAAMPPSSVQNRAVMAHNAPASAASHEPVRTANGGSFAASHANSTVNNHSTGNATRTWSAQGNVTDHGTAPQGAGRNGNSVQTARVNQNDRPDWARSGATNSSRGPGASMGRSTGNVGNRSSSLNTNRAPSTNTNRAYQPGNRSYTPQHRTYSAPGRTYSAPSRTYSAPSHAQSAPSRGASSSGGSHGGGSAPHATGGGGGGSHGGGGGHH